MGPLASTTRIPEEQLRPPPDSYEPPHGLDLRALGAAIVARKIAPFHPPLTHALEDESTEQCPICLQYYAGGLNFCVSCKSRICTDCLIHSARIYQRPYHLADDRSPLKTKDHFSCADHQRSSKCPFCKQRPFQIRFTGPLPASVRRKIQEDAERVEAVQARQRQEFERESAQRRENRIVHEVAQMEAIDGEALDLASSDEEDGDGLMVVDPLHGVLTPEEILLRQRAGFINDDGADDLMMRYVIAQSQLSAYEEERRRKRRRKLERRRLRQLMREKLFREGRGAEVERAIERKKAARAARVAALEAEEARLANQAEPQIIADLEDGDEESIGSSDSSSTNSIPQPPSSAPARPTRHVTFAPEPVQQSQEEEGVDYFLPNWSEAPEVSSVTSVASVDRGTSDPGPEESDDDSFPPLDPQIARGPNRDLMNSFGFDIHAWT